MKFCIINLYQINCKNPNKIISYLLLSNSIIRKTIKVIVLFKQMHHNVRYNQKLSQVINLAIHYKNHRKSLQQVKSALKIPTLKQIQQNQTHRQKKISYAQNLKQFKQNQIQKLNSLQTSRILETKTSLKSFHPQSLEKNSIQKYKSIHNPQKATHDLTSRQKIQINQHTVSHRSISSNLSTRSRRQKQILRQNLKIAERVENPKMTKQLNNTYFNKQFLKQQQYLRIRSRFSERSKNIMQSLTLDGLKMNRKDLGFLPQISKKKPKSKNNQFRTIETSRMSRNQQKDQEKKNYKHIKFLNKIPNKDKTKQHY